MRYFGAEISTDMDRFYDIETVFNVTARIDIDWNRNLCSFSDTYEHQLNLVLSVLKFIRHLCRKHINYV